MKILIDIKHIPHINFFRNAINILNSLGDDITIICLDRGRNINIAKKEFSTIKVVPMGRHKGGFYSIIFQANIFRFFKIFFYMLSNSFDIGIGVDSFILGMVMKIHNKPNLQFYDDPENKKNLFLEKLTATELFYPYFYRDKKIINFYALKEWAYLSPKYFTPKLNVLDDYNLKEKGYIFVREVNSNTTNYFGQKSGIISKIANKLPAKYKVVFSLEDKNLRKLYPKDWIELHEPVEDIYSLMYYSKYVISSGDSMAREGAMLGVPSIYCGIREMRANTILLDKGILFKKFPEEIPGFIEKLDKKIQKVPEQDNFRSQLENEWTDVTQFIIERINYYRENK
ncbi:MAG: DUF354 domain-containing protein [Candidatus Helarchaeota archaeon]